MLKHPTKMNKSLNEIKNKIYKVCNEKFSSVLINLYRDGNDSNGWHADDEKELVKSYNSICFVWRRKIFSNETQKPKN